LRILSIILGLCTKIFCLFTSLYILFVVFSLYFKIKGDNIDLKSLSPISIFKRYYPFWGSLSTLALFVSVIGAINLVFQSLYSENRIGAFYEEDNYNACYEATLYVYEKPVFCLVDIERSTESYENKEISTYYFDKLYLPYNQTISLYEEFDPNSNEHMLFLGDEGHDCRIILNSPASDTSFDRLSHEIISNYGEFCGSLESNIFHLPGCPRVSSIAPQNLIYFQSFAEADILGYQWCDICYQNY